MNEREKQKQGREMLNCRETQRAIDAVSIRSGLAPGGLGPGGLGVDAEQHLKSCTDCGQYATGTFQLMGLLAAQPRVEAPADFEFHLRARIARARHEQHGWRWALAQFLSNSFSWKEAGAAALVLSAVAISATIYVTRETTGAQIGEIATTRSFAIPEPLLGASKQVTQGMIGETRMAEPQRGTSPRAINGTMIAGRTVGSVERSLARAVGEGEMAGAQEILVYQPGRAGRPGGSRSVVIPRRGQVAFGAQLASVRDVFSSRPPAQSAVETF